MGKMIETFSTLGQAQKAKIVFALSVASEACAYCRIIWPEYFGLFSGVKIAIDAPKEIVKQFLFI